MTPLVPRVVSSRRYDLGLRTQVRPYAGEAVTELVSQAGRVLCVGDRGFAAKPCLGRWHISAESLAKKFSLARIRLNCAKKVLGHSGESPACARDL